MQTALPKTSTTAAHPKSVFVSYAHEDGSFVDLMVELLSFHRIRPWHDKARIRPGAELSESLQDGLRNTESMIVVLSPQALESKWVPQELFAFTTLHGTERVYPVRLRDFADNDDVFQVIRGRHAIDFEGNMLKGFRDLTEAFGKPFLPSIEMRGQNKDRRRSSATARVEYELRSVLNRFPNVYSAEARSYAENGQLFVDIVEAFHDVLHSKYVVKDRRSGQPVVLPAAVFEDLILTSMDGFDALEKLVPDFFSSAVVGRLIELFSFEPVPRRRLPA